MSSHAIYGGINNPSSASNAPAPDATQAESASQARENQVTANASERRFERGNSAKSRAIDHQSFYLKDTKAWGAQVWISFAISMFLCAVGLAYLPGAELDRAFMVMGYFFCLSTAFVLSKFVRDNANKKSDTPLFGSVVYVAFAAAIALTAWGLYRMNIPESYKAYLLVSWLYLITTTFTLAKTLRDRHEIALIEARNDAN